MVGSSGAASTYDHFLCFMENAAIHQKPTLLTLPQEILYEILRSLDARSLLTVKQTCATLCRATTDRRLWRDFVRELESRPGHSRLEAPWTDYTSEELAQWTLSRFRVDEFWRTSPTVDVVNPPRTRLFCGIEEGSGYSTLLPGGRWFLMFGESQGKIYAFDLERSEPKGEVLVESGNPSSVEWLWAHWVDSSKQRLSLRVGLWCRSFSEPQPHEIPVEVYKIELVGHGFDAKLHAEHLISIRKPSSGFHVCGALDGEFFLDIRRDAAAVLSMSVTRYFKDGQPTQSKTMTIEIGYQSLSSAHLAWGERIILTGERIEIYSLDQIAHAQLEDAGPVHRISCSPTAATTFGIVPRRLSTPIFLPEAVRFTLAAEDCVWGIDIPRDITIVPERKKLADAPFAWSANTGMGYQHSLFLDPGQGVIEAIRHIWDDSGTKLQGSRRTVTDALPRLRDGELYRLAGYSEELGRIVVYEGHGSTCMVVDVV